MSKERNIDDSELSGISGAGEESGGNKDALDSTGHTGGPGDGGEGPGTDPVGNDNPGMSNIG